MHEDLIKEINEDKKMSLELSDTAYYNVDDGVTDEPLLGEEEELPETSVRPKKRRGSLAAFLLGALTCLAVITLCTQVFGLGHFVTDKKYDYYRDIDKSYGKYYQIMKMIGEDPIAETQPEDISDEQLKEIVSSIGDPYAEYYTASEYAELEKRYMGDYVGVVDDAVSMITGEAGTKVTLTVKRGDEMLDFDLTRQKIETDSVLYDVLEDHPEVGYIRISSFIKGTDDEFKLAVKDLKSKGCSKFILDLRDNGGGLTDPSIEIADYLLPACRIMSENTKDGSETVHKSDASSADLEMVILVNENTASASEILTAALQDNDAGAVIGTKTYGKGVTQMMHRFDDGTAVKITVTEYFRPNGKSVNGIGITPDIEAEGEEVIEEALKELEQ